MSCTPQLRVSFLSCQGSSQLLVLQPGLTVLALLRHLGRWSRRKRSTAYLANRMLLVPLVQGRGCGRGLAGYAAGCPSSCANYKPVVCGAVGAQLRSRGRDRYL
ncbi:hypothetical protein OEZ85_006167 [Tetradesmus obliquus]|uniref:Uncharacterized protein n=1 Tax=Tetradesmus obliquus TaxID=3088 RepID=A0ABY8UFR6_TETOB|nr:hypothetical protein OEZ85_006167 [Tetradesmus obliquus]